MSQTTRTYPAGVSSWIDLETPDATAVAPFYTAVLGWELTDAMPAEAPGHYLIATLEGADVAAIASGVAAIGDEAVWSTYFAVDDAAACAKAASDAGATEVSGPTETPGGTWVVGRDPEGAPFRLWQAGRRAGAQVTNAPGAWNFSHLHTADPAAAFAFYSAVLPWEWEGEGSFLRVPGYGDHLEATVDPDIRERQRHAPEGFEDAIGGLVPLEPGEASHWQVIFTVADRDASAQAVLDQGGTVLATAEDDWTRSADVADPAGARFTLSQFTPQDW